MSRPKAPARVRNPLPTITAEIKIMGRVYQATGEGVIDTLEKLDPGRNVKGMAVLTVSNGTRTITRVLQPSVVMRLFSPNEKLRQLYRKNVYFLFDL